MEGVGRCAPEAPGWQGAAWYLPDVHAWSTHAVHDIPSSTCGIVVQHISGVGIR